jgi:hypothetical protein
VTAVALDSVIASCAEARGFETICGTLPAVFEQLQGRQFDAILLIDVLHLAEEPSCLLAALGKLLSANGSMLVTVPNTGGARGLWRQLKGPAAWDGFKGYHATGIHRVSPAILRKWFEIAGLSVQALTPALPNETQAARQTANRLFPGRMANDFTIRAGRVGQ